MRLWIGALGLVMVVGPVLAQSLPGYERTEQDQRNHKMVRDDLHQAKREIAALRQLPLDDWKAVAVTWGLADFGNGTVEIHSEHEEFFGLQKVRTKKESLALHGLSVEDLPLALQTKKKRDLWLTLPERVGGHEIRCEMSGKYDRQVFAVFVHPLMGPHCQSRPDGET